MAQSVSCKLSLRKIDFGTVLGDMTYVAGKVTLRKGFLRLMILQCSVF